MSAKYKKRTKYKKRKNYRKNKYGTIVLILLLCLFTTFYLLLYTDIFVIKDIKVSGNDYVSQKDIIRLSQLEAGANIFKFNTNNIENQIERHPFIKDAQITRNLPNTIQLSIVEREVTGVIPYRDGNFIYLDEEGVVMDQSETLNTYNVPIITGLENASFMIGNPIEIVPSKLKDSFIGTLSTLKKNHIMDAISEIHFLEDGTIHLYTNEGSVIKVGTNIILKEKLDFIKSFIAQSRANVIVDLSHGGDPVSIPRRE